MKEGGRSSVSVIPLLGPVPKDMNPKESLQLSKVYNRVFDNVNCIDLVPVPLVSIP